MIRSLYSGRPPAAGSTARQPNHFRQSGFSLVELLAVIAILMIVVTIFWGSNPEQKSRARLNACRTNLEKMYMAMEIYSGEYSGHFPFRPSAQRPEEALALLIPRYTVDTAVFVCPGTKDAAPAADKPLEQGTISYAYYMGRTSTTPGEPLASDRQVNAEPKTAGELAFSSTGKPPGNNHGKSGGNILFCNGQVEAAPARVPFALGLPQGTVLLNPKRE